MSSFVTAAERSVAGKITRSRVGHAQIAPAGVDDDCLRRGPWSDGDVSGAERRRQRAMGGPGSDQDRARRLEIVLPRANASGSPGSGGRHQQLGGPARVGTQRALHRAGDRGAEAGDTGVERVLACRRGSSRRRDGARHDACAAGRSLPARLSQRRGRDEDTRTRPSGRRRRARTARPPRRRIPRRSTAARARAGHASGTSASARPGRAAPAVAALRGSGGSRTARAGARRG